MSKKLAVLVLSFALLFTGVVTPSIASANGGNANNSYALTEVDENVKAIADPYIVAKNNKFTIVNEKELKAVVSKEEYKAIDNQLKTVNAMVRDLAKESKVETTDSKTIVVTSAIEGDEVIVDDSSEFEFSTMAQSWTNIKKYAGQNKIIFNWSDIDIWLAKWVVGSILVGTVTAGAALLVKVFPALSYSVAVAVATGVSVYLAGEFARPAYLNYTYGGRLLMATWL
ncbi:hypothetical protein [Bacillus sp. 1P02SD]|uniref:hypothetical protein n=1 Tax=Bacillus sp. 1P02SD TaxID=3132264 RepID=UPI0039A3B475